jgi:hypothetical protein
MNGNKYFEDMFSDLQNNICDEKYIYNKFIDMTFYSITVGKIQCIEYLIMFLKENYELLRKETPDLNELDFYIAILNSSLKVFKSLDETKH